jgi:sensor histidine kinase YesM/ligand-binding sensor domain-containing protein
MKLTLVVWVLLYTLAAVAQEVPMIRYTEKDGLPHAIVYRLMQDSKGYLWVSTDNGLSRFDGSQFVNYTKSDGLGSNFIFNVLETEQRNLLISSYEGGIMEYRFRKGFRQHTPFTTIPYPIDLFQTRHGLFVIDRNYHLFLNGRKKSTLISSIIERKNGEVIAVGNNCIYRYDLQKKRFVSRKSFSKQIYFNSIIELKNGEFLVAESKHIYKFSSDFSTFELLIEGRFLGGRKTFLLDHQDNCWIADLNGNVWMFDARLQHKRLIAKDVLVNQLIEDREHNVWLATYGQGLWCVPNAFITNREVRAELSKDLGLLSKNGQQFIVPLNDLKNLPTPFIGLKAIFNLRLSDYYTTAHGMVYLSERESIFASQNHLTLIRNNTFHTIHTDVTVTKIVKSGATFWVGSRTGLIHLNASFDTIFSEPPLKGTIIYDLFPYTNNKIIAATSKGVFIGKSGSWKQYSIQEGISDEIINTVCYDAFKREIWVGTNDGVYQIDSKGKVTRVEKLGHLRCNDIEIDKKHRIWLATTSGLFLKNRNSFLLFDQEFGIHTGIRKLLYDPSLDKLYALLYNQILEIPIGKILDKQPDLQLTIQLDQVLINDRPIPFKEHQHILFRYVDRSLTLQFSLPVFKHAGQYKIYYRLNGEALQLVSNRHSLRLYNLPFGENKLELIAVDFEGTHLSKQQLTIDHSAPFYLSNWFQLVVFLGLIFVGILISRKLIRSKIKKAERNLETQQQLAELRQKSLQNMLNPHFLNNAINSIQAFVVRNDQRNTLRYLSKLAKLMRLNLELLEASFVTLAKELENIELYLNFEQIRSGEKLSYQLIVSDQLDKQKVTMPAFILQPYVENAIWHGILPKEGNGTILINVDQVGEQMLISITDDGIGIQASEKQKSKHNKISRGTKIIYERLALLNKKHQGYQVTIIDLTLTGGIGTQVQIYIPLSAN